MLQRLARDGQLTRPRSTCAGRSPPDKDVADLGAEANFGNDFVRIGGVKGFMDGSLGSSTAKMFEPYEGGAKNAGVFVTAAGRDAAP